MTRIVRFVALIVIIGNSAASNASEPVTIENVVDPGPNSPEEPIAKEFSLDRAVHFLDSAALTWQKERKCFTCHTNYAYLYARPLVSSDSAAHREVRRYAEQLVTSRWEENGPRWDAEVVATAAALAFNDAATTGELDATTKTALDRMWTIQRDDGGWDWLKCDWPPMENDDHYGVTLAAIAVGVAPGGYAASDAAVKGMAGVRGYLDANPPANVHHQAMLLWAATFHEDLIGKDEREDYIDRLFSLQKADGGWAAASLGNWRRGDGKDQDTRTSDGYGTGFVIYVLRQAGIARDDDRIQRGIQWLESHQRDSGRWFSRSLFRDKRHFLSHAGTAFAVMALSKP